MHDFLIIYCTMPACDLLQTLFLDFLLSPLPRIAKTLAFYSQDRTHAILVVTAGDQKIDNSKFKHFFGMKARMLAREDVEAFTGHGVGGVCPFANPKGAQVYLDISMKRFPTVFPAAGSDNSAIQLTCSQLEQLSHSIDWIDVCKPIQEQKA